MRRVTTRGNVHPHERPRARPSSPGPARRAIASRDADAARDPSPTPRDPSPAPIVASPTRRRIRARRIRARRAGAWNPSVARVSRAIRATRARFAIRDRPTGRLARGGRARVEARVAVAPTDRDRPTACSHCLRIRNGRPASRHLTVCPRAMAPCAKRRHPTPPRRARGDGSRRRRRRRRCSRSARRRSRPAARRWRRERARARREDAPDDARRRARGFRSTSSTAKSETTCLG